MPLLWMPLLYSGASVVVLPWYWRRSKRFCRLLWYCRLTVPEDSCGWSYADCSGVPVCRFCQQVAFKGQSNVGSILAFSRICTVTFSLQIERNLLLSNWCHRHCCRTSWCWPLSRGLRMSRRRCSKCVNVGGQVHQVGRKTLWGVDVFWPRAC